MYDFAERLKTFRKRLGLTQQDLANAVGITKAAISSMERGLTNAPTPDHLFKLSRALGCDPLILLSGKRTSNLNLTSQAAHNLSVEEKLLLSYYAKLSAAQRKELFSSLDKLTEFNQSV